MVPGDYLDSLRGPQSLQIRALTTISVTLRLVKRISTVYSLYNTLVFCIDNRQVHNPIASHDHLIPWSLHGRYIGCYRQPISDATRDRHTGLPAGDVIISTIDFNGSTGSLWLLGWVISLYWSCNRLCILTVSDPRLSDEPLRTDNGPNTLFYILIYWLRFIYQHLWDRPYGAPTGTFDAGYFLSSLCLFGGSRGGELIKVGTLYQRVYVVCSWDRSSELHPRYPV